jgi:low temperature requirement protein LtrA
LSRLLHAALQTISPRLFVRCNMKRVSTMSKQLSVASAFSIFALSALALLGPGSARVSELGSETGATIGIAAPDFMAQLPLLD